MTYWQQRIEARELIYVWSKYQTGKKIANYSTNSRRFFFFNACTWVLQCDGGTLVDAHIWVFRSHRSIRKYQYLVSTGRIHWKKHAYVYARACMCHLVIRLRFIPPTPSPPVPPVINPRSCLPVGFQIWNLSSFGLSTSDPCDILSTF